MITQKTAAAPAGRCPLPKSPEERYRSLIEGKLDLIFEYTPDGILTHASPQVARYGYVAEEIIGENIRRFIHPDDRRRTEEVLLRILESGEESISELRVLDKDGNAHWVESFGRVIRVGGKAVSVIDLLHDITDRKRAENTLQQERDRLQFIIDGADLGTWEWNIQTNETVFNETWARMLGYTLDELSPTTIETWETLTHTDDLIKAYRLLVRCCAGELPDYECELRLKHKDGHWVWVLDRGRIMTRDAEGQPLMMFGTHTDISERKRAEKEMYNLSLVVEASSDAIGMSTPEGKHYYQNKAFNDLFGDVGGDPPSSLYVDKRVGREVFDTVIAGNPWNGEIKMKGTTGAVLDIFLRAFPIKNDSGQILALVGVHTDITRRKQAEEALRASEELFSSIFHANPAAIAVTRLSDNRLLNANNEWLAMTGLTREAVIGRSIVDLGLWVDPRARLELIEVLREKGGVHGFGFQLRQASGTVVDLLLSAQLIDLGGEPCMISLALNITERKREKEALWQSREILRAVLDNIPVRIFWKDRDLNYLGCNLAFARDAGFEDPGQLVGKDDFAMGWREQAEAYRCDDLMVIKEGKTRSLYDELQTTPTGETIHLLTSKAPLRDTQGLIVGVLGTYMDITERIRNQEIIVKFLDRQERLNRLLQSLLAPGPLAQKLKLVTDGVVEIFGADFCRIWCIGQGDLCEQGCMHAEEDNGVHICTMRNKCLQLIASSGRYTHTDGMVHRRVPFGAYKIGLVAAGEEHRFLTNDAAHDPRVHNHDWVRKLGLVSFAGYQLRPPDGETLGVLALFSTHAITTEEDTQLDMLGATTAQVIRAAQTESALSEGESKLRSISMAVPDALVMIDDRGDVTFWNDAATRMFGYTVDEIAGRYLHDFVVPEQFGEKSRKGFARFRTTGEGPAMGRIVELVGKRKDGSEFPVEVSAAPIPVNGRWHAVGIIRDITNRKESETKSRELERQLLQASKLESVGSLAAGIAHEINTPIQFVGDNTRYVSDALGAILTLIDKRDTIWRQASAQGDLSELTDEWQQAAVEADLEYNVKEVPQAIAQTIDGVNRVTEIVRAMKDFAHVGQKERTVSNINEMLKSTLTVARNELKYVSDVITDFDESLPSLECQRNELNQVFLNLLVNAAHAIADVVGDGGKGKGTITVTTRHTENELVISIADTGAGIPENIRDRVFDPFFTTKDVGKGTGQGLAIAHSVVDKHGGQLRFDSTVGQGTTFYIHLPLAEVKTTEHT